MTPGDTPKGEERTILFHNGKHKFKRVLIGNEDMDEARELCWKYHGGVGHSTNTQKGMNFMDIYNDVANYHLQYPEEGPPPSWENVALSIVALLEYGFLEVVR